MNIRDLIGEATEYDKKKDGEFQRENAGVCRTELS